MSDDASRPSPPRRILALALPFLATDRLRRLARRAGRPDDGRPLAVVAREKSALRLAALDPVALGLGLRRGQALAEARAMVPALDAVDADPAADLALLTAIADWADRYTPLVGLDGQRGQEGQEGREGEGGGLLLDIAGCAHLFGGEAALLADLLARLAAQGFRAAAAVADTPGAAWAAARHAGGGVVAPGAAAAMLAPLPLAALRLPAETVAALERLGLKRIGQVMAAPRAPLAARFGPLLLRRLDQALGREEESIRPRRPAPLLLAERRFAEPVALLADIEAVTLSLAGRLAASLEERAAGARLLELALYRVDGAVLRLAVGTGRPVRAPLLVRDLFREKFAGLDAGPGEAVDAGFGFDMVRLAVLQAEAAAPAQADLSGGSGEDDLAALLDRIGARLGPGRVSRLLPQESHLPERAMALAPAAAAAPGRDRGWTAPAPALPAAPAEEAPPERPLRLFPRPEPVETVAGLPEGPPVLFRWRRALYEVARAEGPERIAPEWWRDAEALTRDYYRVEDREGRRFWLYRDGLYARDPGTPRWYLHGLFA